MRLEEAVTPMIPFASFLLALAGAIPATAQSLKAIQAVEQSVFSQLPRSKAATPLVPGRPFLVSGGAG